MILFPNAKINLGLDILSRRPDGYHEVATVMYPLPWCDVLEIVPSSGSDATLTVSGRSVGCPVEKNLVMKAYRALQEAVPGLPAADIYLRKIVPDGAGLGGGSSDAAFTLRGLNDLFALGLDDAFLASVASSLGADCPFFIYNRPMLCTGIGTELEPVDVPCVAGMTVGVVKPAVSVPTRDAYAGVCPQIPEVALADVIADFPYGDSARRVCNAFEHSVLEAYPAIACVKDTFLNDARLPRPVYVSMSGSGSAVYALYSPGSCSADKLSAAMQEVFPDCDVFSSVMA